MDFKVIIIKLGTGERLPTLVYGDTWIPVKVATRWAIRYRRFRVQSSTLCSELRILGRVYTWAICISKLNLDDFLLGGGIFTPNNWNPSLISCVSVIITQYRMTSTIGTC
jgi:hypothetical protein